MFNRRSLYLFLASSVICSIFVRGAFPWVFSISLLITLVMARGLIFMFFSNRAFISNDDEKGYKLLKKAYRAGGVPFFVVNGYIFLSIKFGYLEEASNAIEKFLKNNIGKKNNFNAVLVQKSLYLWQTGRLADGLDILSDLYSVDYSTSIFYDNYGFFLYQSGQLEKAEEICLKGYNYDKNDKTNLDNLISIYIEQEKWELADKYFYELLSLNPEFSECYYHGSIIRLNQDRINEAKDLIERSKEFKLNNLSTIKIEDIKIIEDKIEEKL